MAFSLTRTLPDGTVKSWSGSFASRRKAAQTVAYCLADNGVASRKDATAFATEFENHATAGSAMTHASGYAFTITEV